MLNSRGEHRFKINTDIHVLSQNTEGHDVIVSNVDGAPALLKMVLANMTAKDRLFIAGGLIGRGREILDILLKAKTDPSAPKIHVVRGKEEEVFFEFADAKANPGFRELKDNLKIQRAYELNGLWTQTIGDRDLRRYLDYIKMLPYIIHVSGEFNVVHADMPFNDEELQKRIQNKLLNLTEAETKYATQARPENPELDPKLYIPIKNTGRDFFSLPTYCGYTPLNGVRKNTNHINLNVKSFESNIICAVDHTNMECITYALGDPAPSNKKVNAITNDINEHLKSRAGFTAENIEKANANLLHALERRIQEMQKLYKARHPHDTHFDQLIERMKDVPHTTNSDSHFKELVKALEKEFFTIQLDSPRKGFQFFVKKKSPTNSKKLTPLANEKAAAFEYQALIAQTLKEIYQKYLHGDDNLLDQNNETRKSLILQLDQIKNTYQFKEAIPSRDISAKAESEQVQRPRPSFK